MDMVSFAGAARLLAHVVIANQDSASPNLPFI